MELLCGSSMSALVRNDVADSQVMVTGPMFDSIGWGTYAFFAAMNLVIMLPSVILFFPETRRYSLEDVSLTL